MKLVAVILLVAAATLAATLPGRSSPGADDTKTQSLYQRLVKQRHRADDLQRRLTVRVLQVRRLERRLASHPAGPAEQVAWLARGLECIHGYEGSWTDTGSPFFGGLQMDSGFMAAYAPDGLRAKGTADRWSPVEQLAVGILGWSLRGRTFSPWPTTARMCGLLP